nr:MAG TPA: hypothetical protein [Caudoviricetes sp.]
MREENLSMRVMRVLCVHFKIICVCPCVQFYA